MSMFTFAWRLLSCFSFTFTLLLFIFSDKTVATTNLVHEEPKGLLYNQHRSTEASNQPHNLHQDNIHHHHSNAIQKVENAKSVSSMEDKIAGKRLNEAPFKYCDSCVEGGVVIVRDRGGPRLFIGPEIVENAHIHNKLHQSESNISSGGNPLCKEIIILQADTRSISPEALSATLRYNEESIRSEKDWGKMSQLNAQFSLTEKSFIINSGYAALQNYSYVFVRVGNSIRQRFSGWGKVKALQLVAETCPDSRILMLDSDAYIKHLTGRLNPHPHRYKNLAFGSSNTSKDDAVFAANVDCYWWDYLLNDEKFTDCASMRTHQYLFMTRKWNEGGHSGIFNTGVMMVYDARRALPFLKYWYSWAVGKRSDISKYLKAWPGEQQVLSQLLLHEPQWRDLFLLLDPSAYSGPDGFFIRHLYGDRKRGAEKEGHDVHWTLVALSRYLKAARHITDRWIDSRFFLDI